MSAKVGIIDVGLGNIGSIVRMVEKVQGHCVLIKDVNGLKAVDKLVLPGVGSFDQGVSLLRSSGLFDAISHAVKVDKVKVLGVCLGMQLLCRASDEGYLPGLGLVDASVERFNFTGTPKPKLPHMGWNVVTPLRPNPLLPTSESEQRFYFVHSFKVVPDDPIVAVGSTEYGESFCSAFHRDNVFGVQFHPEKSHRFGMDLFRRFVEL